MKLVVIGEECLDRFEYGKCTRLNPEAPTPVFVSEKTETGRGMAANVYNNLVSVSPRDWEVAAIHQESGEIIKHRFVDSASNYIVLRVDKDGPVEPFKLTPAVITMIHEADIVIVSDYNKGFLTEADLTDISCTARVSFIDTKKPLGKWAQEFDYVKINKKEFENPAHDRQFISNNLDRIIVTLGEDGAILGRESVVQNNRVEVKDVSGAGDTFLAGLVSNYAMSGDILESIRFANLCASAAVSQKGVVSVNLCV